MPEGPLRNAINRWLHETIAPESAPGIFGRIIARWNEAQAVIFEIRDTNRLIFTSSYLSIFVNRAIYALFGDQSALDRLEGLRTLAGEPSPSQFIAEALSDAVGNPAIKEITEIMGALVTEPVLTLFEQYAGDDQTDPKEFARAFHGFMIALNTTGGLADTALETLTGGQVEGAGRMLESMYWSLGLGFLGWQTLAPLLESGLQPGLDRYYKRLYRPTRFSASDLRDLYALGRITKADLEAEGRNIGWRDKDLQQWIELAYKPLSQGDLFQALHAGLLTQDQVATRLRVLGYNPEDLPLLFDLNQDDQAEDEKVTTASTARKAYREGFIQVTELQQVLEELRYNAREIELIIAIEDANRESERVSLTTSQIKQAWGDNVLTDAEALYWLDVNGVTGTVAQVLLETWRAEIIPEFRKLNAGTITAAYINGILDRSRTLSKLQDVGFNSDDAELEVRLAEVRNPEAFGQAPPLQARKLSLSNLNDLALAGIITPQQFEARLIEIGYTSSDAALLTSSLRANLERVQRPLSQSTIERAYLAGVFDRGGAELALSALGFGPDQVEVILNTLEREEAGTFALPPEERGRLLSVGTLQDLYLQGLIDEGTLQTRLEGLGLTAADAALLTQEAVNLAAGVGQPLNLSLIERAYLVGVLDRTRAAEKLAELEYSPEDVENILITIELENPASFSPGLIQSLRLPTIGALIQAVQNGIISPDEFIGRAAEIGYTPEDASLYLALAVQAERKGTKTLTQSQAVNAYGAGLISRGEALQRLYGLGYNDYDANLLLRLEKDFIELTETWQSFQAGQIDPFDVLAALTDAHYSDEDILAAFGTVPPAVLSGYDLTLESIRAALAQIPGGA